MPSTWPMFHNGRGNYSYCFYDSAVDYISSHHWKPSTYLVNFSPFFLPPENAEVDLTFSFLDVPQIPSKCSSIDEVLDPARDPTLLSLGLTKVDGYSVG